LKLKLNIIFFFCSCFLVKASAQNIILNSSFELYDTCPVDLTNVFDKLSICNSWNAIRTPDYFNSCNGGDASVPKNLFGYQAAHTGQGYLGFYVYIGSNREYIQSHLSVPLTSNASYCVQFYVSLADTMQYAVDRIGAYFSDSVVHPVISYPPYFSSYIPQVENTVIVADTNFWTKISGTFIALGGETIITIGNFRDDSNTSAQFIQSCPVFPLSYYYIDDISVYEEPQYSLGADIILGVGDSTQLGLIGRPDITYSWSPVAGLSNPNVLNPIASPIATTTYTLTVIDTNQLACTNFFADTITVFVKDFNSDDILLYPNPSSGNFILEYFLKENEVGQLNVYDLLGKLIKRNELQSLTKSHSIELINLSSGVYLYEIVVNEKLVKTQKLTIIK